MNILITFLLTIASIGNHDIPLALYDFTIKEKYVELKIHFDKEDADKTLNLNAQTKDIENKLIAYIQDRTSWILNNQKLDFELEQILSDEEHYTFQGISPFTDSEFQSLSIENTCLLNIENHSNVINVKYDKEYRAFRLHKARTKTALTP